jgi:hypothetical protein
VEERLRQLDAAAQSARQPVDALARAVGEPEPRERIVDPRGERAPREAVEVPLVAQVLDDGELAVDARRG